MPVPIFQTPVGTFTASAGGGATSLTPPLPVGFAAGDLFIWMTGTKNNAVHTYPAGWTKVVQTNSGAAWTVSWAWKVAVITDGAGTVTWPTTAACESQVWRYNGTDHVNPIGVQGVISVGTTATHNSASITTTRANSLAVVLDAAAANTALGATAGWTSNVSNGRGGSNPIHLDEQAKPMPTLNTASGAIFPTGAAAAWVEQQVEILSPAVAGAGMTFSNMPMLGM